MMNDSPYPYDLIVFDWDGTLMDSEAHIVECMQLALKDVGLPDKSHDDVKNIIGLGLIEAVRLLLPDESSNIQSEVADAYRHHFLSSSKDQQVSPFFPGVKTLLRRLEEAGFFLAVATGKSRRGLDRALMHTGIEDVFHITRCADETFSKPNPEMLNQIMDVLGVEPDRTLMVGDSEYDLQMASNAGTDSVAVSYGVHGGERLKALNPIALIDHIDEIWAIATQQETRTA